MPDITIDQLDTYLKKYVNEALADSAEEIRKHAEKIIEKKWYKPYEPTHYQRTPNGMNFIGSLSSSENPRWSVQNDLKHGEATIYYDLSKMKIMMSGTLPAHANFKMKSKKEALTHWIEEGWQNGGLLGRHDSASRNGIQSMESTTEYYKNGKYAELMAKKLRDFGLSVEIK